MQIKEYVKDTGDYTLYEIQNELKAIETEEDLYKFLCFICDHNYYTGHVGTWLYNSNYELENLIQEYYGDNEEYIGYLTYKCDCSDIFIFKNSKELIDIETKYETNRRIMYCLENYETILTLKEFEDIRAYTLEDAKELIDEVYDIPLEISYYIDYEELIQDKELYIPFEGEVIEDLTLLS